VGSVLFSIPDGRKIAEFATFVRPQGRTKVTNWRYFPSLPTSIHQIEPPNDIIIETKLTLTLTLTLNPNSPAAKPHIWAGRGFGV